MDDAIVRNILQGIYGKGFTVYRMGKIKGVRDKHLIKHSLWNDIHKNNVIVGVHLTETTIWWKVLEII